jgi:hypothetical protein
MTNPNNQRVSPFTSVTLSLGTGEECNNKTNPLNLSHLSDEHLEGLLSSVHAEWKSRIISSKFSHPHKPSPRRSSSLTEKITPEVSEGSHEVSEGSHEVSEGSLLNIGLEQGTTDNETDYIDQCG